MAPGGKRVRPDKHKRAPQREEREPGLFYSADADWLLAPEFPTRDHSKHHGITA